MKFVRGKDQSRCRFEFEMLQAHITIVTDHDNTSYYTLSFGAIEKAQSEQQDDPLTPFTPPAPLGKARPLCGSLIPGTSILGLTLKKLFGLNMSLKCSTGILNVTEAMSNGPEEIEIKLTQASLQDEGYEWY